jgi:hypothetical protein
VQHPVGAPDAKRAVVGHALGDAVEQVCLGGPDRPAGEQVARCEAVVEAAKPACSKRPIASSSGRRPGPASSGRRPP